jgi:hypothetical protein
MGCTCSIASDRPNPLKTGTAHSTVLTAAGLHTHAPTAAASTSLLYNLNGTTTSSSSSVVHAIAAIVKHASTFLLKHQGLPQGTSAAALPRTQEAGLKPGFQDCSAAASCLSSCTCSTSADCGL